MQKYIIPLISLIALVISVYTLNIVDYQLNLIMVLNERTSVENLFINNDLEGALRRYRHASMIRLRNEPFFLDPKTWFRMWSTRPNREPLWIIARVKLNYHAQNYTIKGFPRITGPWSSGSKGTPDEYLGVNLAYADLRDVKLSGCDFTLVDLYRANLKNADLRGSDFSNAFLFETDVSGCDLRSFPGENRQSTKLNVSSDNYTLWAKVASQFTPRNQYDTNKHLRYITDRKTKIDHTIITE